MIFGSHNLTFEKKIDMQITRGRFVIRTISSPEDLKKAFLLRYQVFQVEMIGSTVLSGEDQDEFDFLSDHLAIFDTKTDQMMATCRLNCSLFSSKFYSQQEFNCAALIERPEIKLEIGRVCVHKDFRKGMTIMLLWRGIAEYMKKTETRYLFGCGSVMTLDPQQALLLYRYLSESGKIRDTFPITPHDKYKSIEFDKTVLVSREALNQDEIKQAEKILPSLCRSYFEMGCFTPGKPAFDYDFKCIDFLTILDIQELNPLLYEKMWGTN